jgi:PBP1b-binding outer membrane lipoprotein LpoB
MKRLVALGLVTTMIALLLSGCWDSEEEKKAKEQEQHSKEFWDMGGPTDRSKSKTYTP